jgi:hypothetical protein
MINQAIRRAMTDGNNRKRWVGGGILRKARRPHNKEIGHLPVLQPGVHNALVGSAPHDRSSLYVGRDVLGSIVVTKGTTRIGLDERGSRSPRNDF